MAMGCISSKTFEVEEELVDPEDYNYDPVLILSGRRQSVAPTSVHIHRIKKVSSNDAEAHNRDMVMHLSDPVVVQANSEPASPTRRFSTFKRMQSFEATTPTDQPNRRRISLYRRQSIVEVVTPPGSPNRTRRISLLRKPSTHQEARHHVDGHLKSGALTLQGAKAQSVRVPGRMFSLQQSLPRLPVPVLQQTLDKYLKTAKPLLSEEEFQRANELVKDFGKPGGEGEKLQHLLESRAKNSVNWLEDWWLNTAYLEYRLPCATHVNPGVQCPHQNVSDLKGQLELAAKIVSGIMEYKSMIDDQSLEVEYMGNQPLCMKQFYSILAACRVPGVKKDSIVTFPPNQPNAPNHMVVIHNNHFFSVPVFGTNGKLLSTKQLHQQLQKCVEASTTKVAPVGILTTSNRNSWGKIYKSMSKDPQNKKCAEEIQRSIFVLCLDQKNDDEGVDRDTLFAGQMNHGWGSKSNSGNRWFDKTIQFIVGRDGSLGLNYEHSPAEGPPIISIIDHFMDFVRKDASLEEKTTEFEQPTKLKFNITNELQEKIHEAAAEYDSTIADLDLTRYTFKQFGKEFVKSQKLSPDAFFQVSLQLAYHRLYGQSGATYESGSLRRFQHGRTDTIRSCTIESDAYSKAMDDKNIPDEKKAQMLRDAISSHRKYTADVMMGQGIDRHLLGLKLTAVEHGMNVHDLLMDPVFTTTNYWKVSTSQVPSRFDAVLNFAPVVPDGYGVCYNPMPNQFNYCVSAWNSSPETNSKKLGDSIGKSMQDAHDLLIKTQKSKL